MKEPSHLARRAARQDHKLHKIVRFLNGGRRTWIVNFVAGAGPNKI